MEIKRRGSHQFHGWTTIVKEMSIESVSIDGHGKVQLSVEDLHIPHMSGEYDVVVNLTPEDIGKIIGEVCKQALTKTK